MSAKLKIDHDEFFGQPEPQKRRFSKRAEVVKKDAILGKEAPVETKTWDRKKKPPKPTSELTPFQKRQRKLQGKKDYKLRLKAKADEIKIQTIVEEINKEIES
jgi:hypothetical protein